MPRSIRSRVFDRVAIAGTATRRRTSPFRTSTFAVPPKTAILLQLDTDGAPSVFDAVVAIDAGAERLLRHGGVTPENVASRIHGAIFTRGPDDLHRTAAFIGGSDVARAEAVLAAAEKAFFGPLRISLMLDAGGCNTTAAAATLCVTKHLDPAGAVCLVLGAGPVGQRVARLLGGLGATVRLGERTREHAEMACKRLTQSVGRGAFLPHATEQAGDIAAALDGAAAVIAAGPIGKTVLPADSFAQAQSLEVAVDVNAVPPAGIEGIDATDAAADKNGVLCYGPLGVGGLKMKIHKAAVARLFTNNDLVIDAEETLEIGHEFLDAERASRTAG